ncbi:MFS transporter [Pseudoroseomonas cervicalis]|uniref:MFS transporter n=1 Tax=Teichococcus cervicalis TaxID=204525 RepID=UPI002784D0DD|nr:MFS transporter [Pseudoroseomonas cervicalis]MDQ1080012.1 PPP family 3-phenylpropionic acid transporter [Pseudoroseomonas cervicalis]
MATPPRPARTGAAIAALPYLALSCALFAAIGIGQPFLPAFLAARGLSPGEIALALALGSAVRLVAGPVAGRWADGMPDPRRLLAIAAFCGALAALGYGLASGLAALLLVQAAFSAASAPLIPLSDTLSLAASRQGRFDYGLVRAGGSMAFMAAAALAGLLVGQAGVGVVPLLLALAMLAVVVASLTLPRGAAPPPRRAEGFAAGFAATLRRPGLLRLLLLSGLIQASHAAYYGFAAIHWGAAGHSAMTIGLLWAEGVVGEIALFLLGRRLLGRLGPGGLALLAAGAGLLRWLVLAATSWLPALVATQWLHAFSFGAQHLAAMHLLLALVPAAQAGTAQTLHAALGVGLLTGVMTLASGPLYAWFGGGVFLAMALLCALALPLALSFRRQPG